MIWAMVVQLPKMGKAPPDSYTSGHLRFRLKSYGLTSSDILPGSQRRYPHGHDPDRLASSTAVHCPG